MLTPKQILRLKPIKSWDVNNKARFEPVIWCSLPGKRSILAILPKTKEAFFTVTVAEPTSIFWQGSGKRWALERPHDFYAWIEQHCVTDAEFSKLQAY